MLLNSLAFFLLLPVALFIFYNCKGYSRIVFLYLISLGWIMSYNISSLVFLLFFNTSNYYAALGIGGKRLSYGTRKIVYSISQLLNITGFLFINKIPGNFFLENTNSGVAGFNTGAVLIAAGLGFYSLQNIGYLMDVNKKRTVPEPDYLLYSLYNMLFMRLNSGPIMLYNDFSKQFAAVKQPIKSESLNKGFQRILLGLIKKIVLADRLMPLVAATFESGRHSAAFATWLGVLMFLVQLYFDFSGYMDLAIGTGNLFGIALKENFNLPLRATSITLFWRKWHISLMDWLSKYVFYPVNYRFRKHPKIATPIAIATTFLVSGIWHGAGITFMVYACFHFLMVLFEYATKTSRARFINSIGTKLGTYAGRAITILLVGFSLVFFRAGTMENAFQIIYSLFDLRHLFDNSVSWSTWLINGGTDIEATFNIRACIAMSVLLLVFEKKINQMANAGKWNPAFIISSLILIIVWGVLGNSQRFIYLQF